MQQHDGRPLACRALDAALTLVGQQGIRALTHARVDDAAGLPKGSTSNWFRTRAALIAGVVDWLVEREREDFAAGAPQTVETVDQLVEALTGMIAAETGPFAARTRARYALFLEAAGDPDLLAPLLAQRRAYVEWMTAVLSRVDTPPSPEAVQTLMATAEGVILHRLTVDPDAEIRPIIERAARACLAH